MKQRTSKNKDNYKLLIHLNLDYMYVAATVKHFIIS